MSRKYPEHILQKLRQREGFDANDKSIDEQLNLLSPSEAFSEVCNWEGLIYYDRIIKVWIKSIYGIDIDELVTEWIIHFKLMNLMNILWNI